MELDSYIIELLDIMKREIQSFNMVSELLILEEKSLVEFNTKELAGILERQEDVFSSIACLEKSRLELLGKIGEQLEEKAEMLTLKRLTGMVDGPLKKQLLETGHVLDTIHENIKKKKIANSMLIKQGVMLVESDIRVILNAIDNPENKKSGYSSNAEPGRLSGGICIDGRL